MKYCQKCIMPTTRPGLVLDDFGICGACNWHDSKIKIDWDQRKSELIQIANKFKKINTTSWDCVLGVSGGKDSTWQAMYIRDELGLTPLLVQYACSDGTNLGRENLENLVNLGFELITVQPSPLISRKLSKHSFYKYGNIQKYAEMALFPTPFRTAMQYEIPLVFFGENPALEAGDKNATLRDPWDATSIQFNNTLGGHSYKIWLDENITEKDLILYQFPNAEEFSKWGGKGIFMGYYINWDGVFNAKFAIEHGLKTINDQYKNIGIPYLHNSLDSNNNGVVNALLKFIKLGFGNTTEFLCYDIRNKRISREEAALIVKELDGKCHDKYIQSYCDWIDITVDEFWKVANSFRGNMWNPKGSDWKLINPIWEQVDLPNVNYNDLVEKLNQYSINTELTSCE